MQGVKWLSCMAGHACNRCTHSCSGQWHCVYDWRSVGMHALHVDAHELALRPRTLWMPPGGTQLMVPGCITADSGAVMSGPSTSCRPEAQDTHRGWVGLNHLALSESTTGCAGFATVPARGCGLLASHAQAYISESGVDGCHRHQVMATSQHATNTCAIDRIQELCVALGVAVDGEA